MQTFYVIIKKEYLSIYDKIDNSFTRVYLDGNPEYSYSVNSAKDYVNRLVDMIIDENNLDSEGEIDFVVIDNEDEIISKALLNAFGESVKKIIDVEALMADISNKICSDKKLHIPEYGINFDGKKYLVKDNKLVKEEFSLLSYNLTDDMLMKSIG